MEENKSQETVNTTETQEQPVAMMPATPQSAPRRIKDNDTIDLGVIFSLIMHKKKLFFIVLTLTFVLSVAIILCVPRTYSTTTRVAPEAEAGADGTLGSIASSFGINLGDGPSSDAIYPMLYPDLMEDNGFISKLFDIRVTSADGTINTTYYDYLEHYQLHAWWDKYIKKLKKLLPADEPVAVAGGGGKGKAKEFNPYILNRKQTAIVNKIKNTIGVSCDKRTSVITIDVQMQDPLICKTVADSVRVRLQNYITVYRTEKARKDVAYYANLAAEAKDDYEKARRQFSAFSDANTEVELPSLRGKMEDLENDLQLKYNTYTAMNTQLQAAKAKLQERTPAFTLLQGATMPIKASGPKRMIFVIGMCMLAFLATTAWVIRKNMHFTI